jgi:putative ABC transport system permease protein
MNDLKFAFRQLRKNPGFTTVAVLTLALGIGATSAVFCLIHGVLLTPPPYPKPEQIALIAPVRKDGQAYPYACTTAQWIEWQKATNSFAAIAGYEWGFQFLVLPDGSESLQGLFVTPDYFNVMGVKPLLGREFLPADVAARGGQETAIILGYNLWQRRFDGNSNVLGKVVHLSRRQPMTVVGIMPPKVRFLPSRERATEPNYDVNAQVDYWVPLWPPNLARPKEGHCNMVGRLRERVTSTQAQAELAAIAARQAQSDHDFAGITVRTHPLEMEWNREGRRLLIPVAGAVALVFLIACGNAAGLLLARGLQRQHEYAVRAALGAGPFQLCRPILAESLLLALLGGLVGVGLAVGCVDALKLISGTAIPRLDAVRLGWPVLVFCVGAASVAGLFAGLLPAWRSLGLDPANELKAGSRTASVGRTERRLLGGVAAVQIALTLALLVGASLLIQTVRSLATIRPGYDTHNVLAMSVTAVGTNWLDFHTRAIERVAQLPGVQSAAFGWGVPLTGNKWNTTFEMDGQSDAGALKDKLNLPTRSATPDYFATLGLTLAEGRGFRPSDNGEAPMVAVVNRAMADRYFPNQMAVGRKLRFPGNRTNLIEIIGVLANSRTDALTDVAEPELYFSFWQSGAFSKHLVLRTHADPRSLITAVQKELRAIDPTVSIEKVKTLEEIRDESVASRTFAMNLLVGFALVACLLATVGIYGVLSLAAGARRTEMAIRMAVGAQRGDVLRLILSDGLRLAMAGVGLGLVVALMLAAGLKTYLFGVGPADPLTLAGMVAVVIAVTLATGWIPARRATRVDPLTALRNE